VFHVEARKFVTHADRDTEFISLKRDMMSWLEKNFDVDDGRCFRLGMMSCEMIAQGLASAFELFECIVFEDGENGGGVVIPENAF
jgi:hypothetical protein